MTATGSELQAWLQARRHAVDEALDAIVPANGEPAVVWEAMRYSLFAGGKRLRPVLALAAAEAVALRLGTAAADAQSLAMPAACALELIHTYSLVHDDLPAMDDDVLRRGRPTAHVVYGEGLAILAGDALLTEAFAHLATKPRSVPGVGDAELATRKIAVIRLIADAAGPSGMVGGQAIDLRAAGKGTAGDGPAPLDSDGVRDMHARKTGALIRAAALAGASMAGADATLGRAVDEYASQVGLAFQIVDDILDVEGASADLGKTAGKDAAAGKPTYPALYGLEASRRLAAECIERSLGALERAGLHGQLPALAGWVVGRQS